MIPTRGNFLIIVAIFAVLAIGFFYTWSVIEKRNIGLDEKSPAALSLDNSIGSPYTDLDANPIALTNNIGEVLVVTSWASWCPACTKELEQLVDLAREYEDRGVKVIGINRSEPTITVKSFLKSMEIPEDLNLVLDSDDRYFKSIGGHTMPETVIYDTKGNVVYHKEGEMSKAEMRLYVDRALNISD